METTQNKNTATFIHLSALAQYIVPMSNFILPIVIWSSVKNDSGFVEKHGRNAINFQLSLFLYTVILCLVAFPVLLYSVFSNIPLDHIIINGETVISGTNFSHYAPAVIVAVVAVILFVMMKAAEFFLVIHAAVEAANGKEYRYPLTIDFIKQKNWDGPTLSGAAASTE